MPRSASVSSRLSSSAGAWTTIRVSGTPPTASDVETRRISPTEACWTTFMRFRGGETSPASHSRAKSALTAPTWAPRVPRGNL